jgi:hypothetical protein
MQRRDEISSPYPEALSGSSIYVFQKIQSRRNNSLIQTVGGSVKAVPASLFPMIQENLNEKDYRNLMNTSLSAFQDIKYETVRYTFPSLFEWRKVGLSMNPPINLPTIINYIYSIVEHNVKDLSKQVSLRFQGRSTGYDHNDLLDNMYYQELYKLSRCCKVIFRNCPSIPEHYFDNIYHVIIDTCKFIDSFPPGLQNISILEIYNCEYLSDIKNIDGLQQLIIAGSGVAQDFCNFHQIPVVRVDWNKVSGEAWSFSLPLTVFPQFSFLQELILKMDFKSVTSTEYQCLINIPLLCLHHLERSRPRPMIPVLLHARILEISGFDIDSCCWEGATFANLEMLRFEDCTFKGVNRLSASFPVLHTLEIIFNVNLNLSTISSLKTLRVKDISFYLLSPLPTSLSFLSLEFVSSLPDSLECFATITHLEFIFCSGLRSLEGLSECNRVVRLRRCRMITDFRPLRNVHRLCLEDMEVVDTQCFRNIKHLKFVNCTGLKAVTDLENVETLYISECNLLKELPSYDRVKISVWNCPNLTSNDEGVNVLKSPGHVEFVPLDETVNLRFKGYKPL